jgi:AcrR family transcriptional regulator
LKSPDSVSGASANANAGAGAGAGASTRKGGTVQRILAAARQEFSDKGFDAARLESIARSACVTKQLVHHYFRSKDELYRIVFDTVARSVLPLLEQSQYRVLSPTDAIRLLVNRIIDLHLEKPGVTTFTLDQGLHRGAHIDAQTCFVPLTREFIHTVIAPILQRGVESGDFRGGVDPTLFYATTFHVASGCFLMGPAMTQTIGIPFDTPEGVAVWRAHATDFVLAALRAATPAKPVRNPRRPARRRRPVSSRRSGTG